MNSSRFIGSGTNGYRARRSQTTTWLGENAISITTRLRVRMIMSDLYDRDMSAARRVHMLRTQRNK